MDFTIGIQPCDNYAPEIEYHEYGCWGEIHQCYKCGGVVSYCKHCAQYHHDGGFCG